MIDSLKGGYQTDETGLQLLGHRYYDPSTGRFLTRDPIKDGRKRYGYCGNNPVGGVDAAGLSDKRDNAARRAAGGDLAAKGQEEI